MTPAHGASQIITKRARLNWIVDVIRQRVDAHCLRGRGPDLFRYHKSRRGHRRRHRPGRPGRRRSSRHGVLPVPSHCVSRCPACRASCSPRRCAARAQSCATTAASASWSAITRCSNSLRATWWPAPLPAKGMGANQGEFARPVYLDMRHITEHRSAPSLSRHQRLSGPATVSTSPAT